MSTQPARTHFAATISTRLQKRMKGPNLPVFAFEKDQADIIAAAVLNAFLSATDDASLPLRQLLTEAEDHRTRVTP